MSGKSILPMLKSKKESIIAKSEKYHYQPAKTKKLSVLFFRCLKNSLDTRPIFHQKYKYKVLLNKFFVRFQLVFTNQIQKLEEMIQKRFWFQYSFRTGFFL